ncbi:MAG: hypothetical protein QXE18_01120 [Thermoplasmata archaeon]
MPATREMLEGEAYWGRIRHIKQTLYIMEIVLIAALGLVLVFFYSETQTNPFFLSIDRLIWFLIIMMLIIEIESFIFRIMQIRIARTFSTKHLMTSNSIRRAIIVIIVAAILLVIFALPAAVQSVESAVSYRGTLYYTEPAQIVNGDPIGLSTVKSITLSCDVPVDVYLLRKQDYQNYANDWTALRNFCLNDNGTRIMNTLIISVPPMAHQYLYLVIDPTTTSDEEIAVVSFTLNQKLSDTLTAFLPLMCVIFIAVNGAWMAYLMPLSKKYATRSIYK